MTFFKTLKQFLTIMDQENVLWKNNIKIQEGILKLLKESNERIVHLEKMMGIRK